MGKLQTNFSWQKYEGEEENQKNQFQYQLQSQHIQVSNTVNATIDDLSYFTQERQTSFVWVNNTPIYTKTLPTSAWGGGGTTNSIPLNIVGGDTGNFQIINMVCTISDGTLSSSNTLLLPHIDVAVAANAVSIVRNGTSINLVSGGSNRSAYSGYVTVYYIKS